MCAELKANLLSPIHLHAVMYVIEKNTFLGCCENWSKLQGKIQQIYVPN